MASGKDSESKRGRESDLCDRDFVTFNLNGMGWARVAACTTCGDLITRFESGWERWLQSLTVLSCHDSSGGCILISMQEVSISKRVALFSRCVSIVLALIEVLLIS